MPDCSKGRLYRIGGPNMRPVLGRKVVETEQYLPILDQNAGRLGGLCAKIPYKPIKCLFCLSFGFSHPDFMQPRFGFAVDGFRQFIKHIGGLVYPAALATGLRPCFIQSRPKTQGAVAYGQFRRCL